MVALGIDFGTSTTVVALADRGKIRVLIDPASKVVCDPIDDKIIPSYVSFHPNGQVYAGRAAKARRGMDPANTVHSFKRIIGLPATSSQVKKLDEHYAMVLESGTDGVPRFVTRAGKLTSVEISSYLLASLREQQVVADASRQKVMITVPPSFSPTQGEAILEAARRAGFSNAGLVDESSAAAFARLSESTSEQLVGVFDLGGGTFDLSIVRTDGKKQDVVAFGGDPYLGGDDIDMCLAKSISKEVLEKHRWDLQSTPDRFSRLLWACEQTKIALSASESAELWLTPVDPMLTGKNVVVSRSFFEKLVHWVVQRTFVVCDDVLSRAGVTAERLDSVVLAGGGSYIPYVRKAVASYFGSEPVARLPPDKVVGIGAAVAAERMNVA